MTPEEFMILKIGDKVTYGPKSEKGIVKTFSNHNNTHAFIVYHCDNNWDRYFDYTGAYTYYEHLSMGWEE